MVIYMEKGTTLENFIRLRCLNQKKNEILNRRAHIKKVLFQLNILMESQKGALSVLNSLRHCARADLK